MPPENAPTIFNKIFSEGFKMSSFIIIPMFVILISTLLPQIEYKNNAWKQVLASPLTKGNIFAAKYINLHLFFLLFLVANHFLMVVAGVVLHFVHPSLKILNQTVDTYSIFVNIVNTYTALLAITAAQFWMGLRFKNFIAPLAIGISLWIMGSILVIQFDSKIAAYFPYSAHVYVSFPQFKSKINTVEWASGLYTIVFLILGFLDFKKRTVKS
ncbi:MAG: ABC transporter permease [Bacteroidota bacterium]